MLYAESGAQIEKVISYIHENIGALQDLILDAEHASVQLSEWSRTDGWNIVSFSVQNRIISHDVYRGLEAILSIIYEAYIMRLSKLFDRENRSGRNISIITFANRISQFYKKVLEVENKQKRKRGYVEIRRIVRLYCYQYLDETQAHNCPRLFRRQWNEYFDCICRMSHLFALADQGCYESYLISIRALRDKRIAHYDRGQILVNLPSAKELSGLIQIAKLYMKSLSKIVLQSTWFDEYVGEQFCRESRATLDYIFDLSDTVAHGPK